MTTKKQVLKSNGYQKRRFFTFLKNGTIPASFNIGTPTDTDALIAWSPTLKKYFFADTLASGKVYSQSPDGNKILVHTCSGTVRGCHWSKTLSMLVVMTSTHIYTSSNGTDFTSRTIPASYAPDSNISTFVDASTYLLVFAREGSTTGYMYKTTNGITWVRSTSGADSTEVIAGAIGDTVGYFKPSSGSGGLWYTSNGTTYSACSDNGSVDHFFPPTTLRPEFWIGTSADTHKRSTDGITYNSVTVDDQGAPTAGAAGAWFGGVMRKDYTTAETFEYLCLGSTSPGFVGNAAGFGTYPDSSFFNSIEGEYATYAYRTKAHRVGTWLDIGDHEVWLIGGGAPNANTTVGGTAGCMVIHRLTVTEKWRYCVYVYLGAAAIVDTSTGEFLAYASMLTSTSTSAQVNTAGFGSEVYPGLGSGGVWGAACGPSNGGPAFMALTPENSSKGCMTKMTTSATTPPDFWTLWDLAGNPSGTGYPGTAGDTLAAIGFCGGPTATTVTGSFGSGGCNSSTALATVGGEPLAIIYSN